MATASAATFRERAEYASVRALCGGLRWLPLPLAYASARLFVAGLIRLTPRYRRVARTNLEIAFPGLGAGEQRRILSGMRDSLARVLITVARAPALRAETVQRLIRYDGLEHYIAAKAKGRGVIVATAHLGNWELSALAHALMWEPMHVMVRPLDNRLLDRWLTERRESTGNCSVIKTDSARAVLRALKANQAVGILADQNASLAEGVFIDFFGRKACAHATLTKLAHHASAPVVPGFALWNPEERRYVLRFYPEVPLSGDPTCDTQRVQAFFEQLIRAHPEQWLWIHRRWKTRPPGEPGLY